MGVSPRYQWEGVAWPEPAPGLWGERDVDRAEVVAAEIEPKGGEEGLLERDRSR